MSNALLNAVSYAELYLEMRIAQCKQNGECTKEYEQELDEIKAFWMAELKKGNSDNNK